MPPPPSTFNTFPGSFCCPESGLQNAPEKWAIVENPYIGVHSGLILRPGFWASKPARNPARLAAFFRRAWRRFSGAPGRFCEPGGSRPPGLRPQQDTYSAVLPEARFDRFEVYGIHCKGKSVELHSGWRLSDCRAIQFVINRCRRFTLNHFRHARTPRDPTSPSKNAPIWRAQIEAYFPALMFVCRALNILKPGWPVADSRTRFLAPGSCSRLPGPIPSSRLPAPGIRFRHPGP